jgi:hypothetical protein
MSPRTSAHKPITSPFTFYDDVLPITMAQCGSCHEPEGIAPMSLLSHESAVPWGESMRLELVAGHMPPWASIAPQDRFRDRRRLSARELNVLLTWAAGGTPAGDTPRSVDARAATWPLGTPSETLNLPAAELPTELARLVKETVLPLAPYVGRRLAGVDLRPGLPSVVRNARLTLRGPARGEQVIGLWVPGDEPSLLPPGVGWSIDAGAELVVRVSYRKRWDREREPASDRSTVGLYFAMQAGSEATAVALRASAAPGADARTGSLPFGRPARALALWPEPALAGAVVRVETVDAAGVRTPLATLAPRAEWERRYWLKEPLDLPAGSTLRATATWPATAPPPPAGTVLLGVDTLPR